MYIHGEPNWLTIPEQVRGHKSLWDFQAGKTLEPGDRVDDAIVDNFRGFPAHAGVQELYLQASVPKDWDSLQRALYTSFVKVPGETGWSYAGLLPEPRFWDLAMQTSGTPNWLAADDTKRRTVYVHQFRGSLTDLPAVYHPGTILENTLVESFLATTIPTRPAPINVLQFVDQAPVTRQGDQGLEYLSLVRRPEEPHWIFAGYQPAYENWPQGMKRELFLLEEQNLEEEGLDREDSENLFDDDGRYERHPYEGPEVPWNSIGLLVIRGDQSCEGSFRYPQVGGFAGTKLSQLLERKQDLEQAWVVDSRDFVPSAQLLEATRGGAFVQRRPGDVKAFVDAWRDAGAKVGRFYDGDFHFEARQAQQTEWEF